MTIADLSNLFDKLETPVVAFSDGEAVYFNPAAQMQLGDISAASQSAFAESSATFNGKTFDITESTALGHNIYYLSPKYSSDDLLYQVSARLKEKIAELKLMESILTPLIENIGDAKLCAYTQNISKTISVLHRMAGNLGYFQSFDNSSFCPVTFDLAASISDIADSVPVFVGNNCPEIIFKCGSGDMTVQADRIKIELALFQLLSNSLKHTEKDGRILIKLSRTENNFILTVSDNGCGMSATQLSSAWTPGNADITVHGGVGVGLPIVQSIALLHGGHAIIGSDKNGTTVSVSIPAIQKDADNLSTPAAKYDSGLADLMLQLSEVIPPEHFSGKFTN